MRRLHVSTRPAGLVSLLLGARYVQGDISNDFSPYPEDAQSCLYSAADASGCSGDSGAELNSCLCTNETDFVSMSAYCIGQDADYTLGDVYSLMSTRCAGTGTPLTVSEDEWYEYADVSETLLSSTALVTPTTTPTSTPTTTEDPSTTSDSTTNLPTTSAPTQTTTSDPTSTEDPDTGAPSSSTTRNQTTSTPTPNPTPTPTPTPDPGLTTGAKIGVGVGGAFGAIALGLAAWFIWAYARRKNGGSSGGFGRSNHYHDDDGRGGGGPGTARMDYPVSSYGASTLMTAGTGTHTHTHTPDFVGKHDAVSSEQHWGYDPTPATPVELGDTARQGAVELPGRGPGNWGFMPRS
ncbi:hypothetical protein F4780DRAFT_64263 [Xylariomycetidae sp. FL0641]|nr:hypothetical protein F4780DRAFT_64263 [Xylariomycetidae sp. FL0641]